MRARSVLACYLLLASIYLYYLPHAEFVLDDWIALQKFEQARARGLKAEMGLVVSMVDGRFRETFRTHWLSLIFFLGLYHIGGLSPAFYFSVGVLLQAIVGYLLYLLLIR